MHVIIDSLRVRVQERRTSQLPKYCLTQTNFPELCTKHQDKAMLPLVQKAGTHLA